MLLWDYLTSTIEKSRKTQEKNKLSKNWNKISHISENWSVSIKCYCSHRALWTVRQDRHPNRWPRRSQQYFFSVISSHMLRENDFWHISQAKRLSFCWHISRCLTRDLRAWNSVLQYWHTSKPTEELDDTWKRNCIRWLYPFLQTWQMILNSMWLFFTCKSRPKRLL